MKNKHVLLIVCILVITCLITIFILSKNKKQNETHNDLISQNSAELTENLNSDNLSEQKIESIKQDLGYNSIDDTIYDIKKEYDGREIITIKPTVQYKVAMAGAIKNGKPEFSEIDNLLEQVPNKSGIWITKDSREKVLNILKELTKANYKIDNNGYLVQEDNTNTSEIDEKIKRIINGKRLYAIDIDNTTYIVDEVTGNIEEYPFVEIDPKAPFEIFEIENASLYVVTENSSNKLSAKSIMDEVLNTINR